MSNLVDRCVGKLGRMMGYSVQPKRTENEHPDIDQQTLDIYSMVRPYTATSLERVHSLCQSVEYVVKNEIPGDIVECGVWKGGSMMAVAKSLLQLKASRKLYLYDTYEGMTEPTADDQDFRGVAASEQKDSNEKQNDANWYASPLDEVKQNFAQVGYDMEEVRFVKGMVEDTIPSQAPDQISLLRLDTDWFESTYHELVHLYPRLSVGGVLIIDDYGHWQGARKAVDQYIEENKLKLLLSRVDYTARMAVKIEA